MIIVNYSADLDWSNIERAFRKLDEDNDKKINFQEFLRSMRPIYCYRKYEHYVPQLREVSDAKLIYSAKEPRPMKQNKKDLKKSQIDHLSSDPQIKRQELV